MAGPLSYLQRVGGRTVKTLFTVVGGTPAQAGAGVGLDDNGLLDPSVIPSSVSRVVVFDGPANGAIPARSLIYIAAGKINLASAAAGSAHDADGYVTSAIADGATGRAYLSAGVISGFSGLTADAPYFLSETAGGITATPVTGTGGKLDQYVGVALSTTQLEFDPEARGVLLP